MMCYCAASVTQQLTFCPISLLSLLRVMPNVRCQQHSMHATYHTAADALSPHPPASLPLERAAPLPACAAPLHTTRPQPAVTGSSNARSVERNWHGTGQWRSGRLVAETQTEYERVQSAAEIGGEPCAPRTPPDTAADGARHTEQNTPHRRGVHTTIKRQRNMLASRWQRLKFASHWSNLLNVCVCAPTVSCDVSSRLIASVDVECGRMVEGTVDAAMGIRGGRGGQKAEGVQ